MSINLAAFEEILKREDTEAAKNYLVNTEKVSEEEANNIIASAESPTLAPIIPTFYCEKDKELWSSESPLCPKCGCDVLKDECLIQDDAITIELDKSSDNSAGELTFVKSGSLSGFFKKLNPFR